MKKATEKDVFVEANRQWDAGHTKRAFQLMSEAAKNGHKYAPNSLGYFYDHGIGTKINKEKARAFYRRAARSGDTVSYANLAACYADLGKRQLAISWYEKAVRAGDGDAAVRLAKLYLEGNLTRSAETGAFRALRQAMKLRSITPAARSQAKKLLNKIKTKPA